MRKLRAFLFCLLALTALSAQAQRVLVPVVNFEDIPVALATDKSLTVEQVRQAFIEAGEDTRWSVVPAGDGLLEATFVKQNKHTVVVAVRHDAEKYSVTYKSSENMKFREAAYPNDLRAGWNGVSRVEEAAGKQRALFAAHPESQYAKADPQAVIHPFFEAWVHDLLEAVRLKLKRAQ